MGMSKTVATGIMGGIGGRWVTLMRRRLLPTGEAESPEPGTPEIRTPESGDAPTDESAEASA